MENPLGIDDYLWPTEIDQELIHNTIRRDDGKTHLHRWRQAELISSGAQGNVWLQRSKSRGKVRAVKRIARQALKGQEGNFKRELGNMARVSMYREAFVQFYGWYQDADWNFIAMEYVEHGDLHQYVKEYGEKARMEVREITKQLLQALVILDGEKICHRDLKPQNILVCERSPIHVKITDFGLSKHLVDTNPRTACGTQGYLAPELQGILQANQRSKHCYAVDIWSLGCVVYLILTSETPFLQPLAEAGSTYTGLVTNQEPLPREPDIAQMVGHCKGGTFPATVLRTSEATGSGMSFAKQMLVAKPDNHVSPTAALQHPWLSEDPAVEVDKPNAIKAQFVSLGIKKITADVIKEKLAECGAGTELNEVAPPEALMTANMGDLRYRAATQGYRSALHLLLRFQSTYTIDYRVHGWTSLQAASLRGYSHVVGMLLEMGADVNAEPAPESGLTALQAAEKSGSIETVLRLLKPNASVDSGASSSGGTTTIDKVTKVDHGSGADVAKQEVRGDDGPAHPKDSSNLPVVKAREHDNHSPLDLVTPVVSATTSSPTVSKPLYAAGSNLAPTRKQPSREARQEGSEESTSSSPVPASSSFEDKFPQTHTRSKSNQTAEGIETLPEEPLQTSYRRKEPSGKKSPHHTHHQRDQPQASTAPNQSNSTGPRTEPAAPPVPPQPPSESKPTGDPGCCSCCSCCTVS